MAVGHGDDVNPVLDRTLGGQGGEDGVAEVIQVIMHEFRMVMRQTRPTSIDQIPSRFVMEAENPIMTRLNEFGFGL